MSPDQLRKSLADVVARGDFQVPPYPAVALRLQRIFARANYSLAEVSDTIAADPALTARVLGVVNSALYRAADDITSLPRAVNRLGARVVSSLALAAGLGSNATQAGALFDVILIGLIHGFGRSVAVAALERLLAEQRAVTPLVLFQWLAVAEEQRAELALAVGSRWQLPAEILAALRPEAASTPLAVLVAEGERIATQLEGSWRPEPASPAEARALDELIQGLPAALDALAAVPPAEPGRAASAVAPTDHALQGERRAVTLAVADCKKQKPAALSCLGITASGLELTSSLALQEGALVKLAVGAADQRTELWFNVLLCAPTNPGWRVEVELFSPTREVKERWQALFSQAHAA
jgi:hypothetical protein